MIEERLELYSAILFIFDPIPFSAESRRSLADHFRRYAASRGKAVYLLSIAWRCEMKARPKRCWKRPLGRMAADKIEHRLIEQRGLLPIGRMAALGDEHELSVGQMARNHAHDRRWCHQISGAGDEQGRYS